MRLRGRFLIAYNGTAAGLGNRMRVVLGAKSLAEYEERTLLYVWPRGPRFEPRLDDLWTDPPGWRISIYASRALSTIVPYEERDVGSSEGKQRGPRIRQIRTGGELVLPPGARNWRDEFRALTPASEIADRVTAFSAKELAGLPYIGVQIRAHRVSHEVTKASSPVEWYFDRMRQIEQLHRGVRFFVSCDVPDVFDDVLRIFPTAVGLRDKGGYNTVAGVQSSVADLYLLGGAGYLLGPYGSSFVHLAEHLSGDRVFLETARAGLRGPIDFESMGIAHNPLMPHIRDRYSADIKHVVRPPSADDAINPT